MKLKGLYIPLLLLLIVLTSLSAQNQVKIHEGVEIGGIKQWIGAKSNDDSKPLLLFLHGGPGFSSRTYAKSFIKHLKKDFIVAQWDQRNTGITAAWNLQKDTITLEQMHNDTKEVVNYLLKRFKKEKLYLVGFSWGGFLGLNFSNKYPELLHAYISVSSIIYGNKSEELILKALQEKVKGSNNERALEEISKINLPIRSWEELYYQRKWAAYFFNGVKSNRKYPKSLFKEWSIKWMKIFQEASMVNYAKEAPRIHCPIYFFISKNDFITNHMVTKNYYKNLEADQKQIIYFDQSFHEIPTEEPKKFSSELIKISHHISKS
ncbi:alpha/beta hydrolase [Aquimarina gracilis]|uniref:Alpha/beta hydrolase n=1 Tax=Aquimarina gracilis TaxID=874422 RepID=A0ABU5ZSU3_9FLAO|nr:alpha/beta hydrolase [Aquimarina gracilis]MEB3344452.1 alpha/beta hydrolase [Aquimarina gracilis]